MLNTGPYIMEAVQALDGILRRMRGHRAKKRSMLRELHLVSSFREARTRPERSRERVRARSRKTLVLRTRVWYVPHPSVRRSSNER